jgi:hypothetical protein
MPASPAFVETRAAERLGTITREVCFDARHEERPDHGLVLIVYRHRRRHPSTRLMQIRQITPDAANGSSPREYAEPQVCQ